MFYFYDGWNRNNPPYLLWYLWFDPRVVSRIVHESFVEDVLNTVYKEFVGVCHP